MRRSSPRASARDQAWPGSNGAPPVEARTVTRAGAGEGEAGPSSGHLRLLRASAPSSPSFPSPRGTGAEGARSAIGGAGERQRLERDLHDGVQTELIALIVKLAVARQDPDTPPALADTLAGLEAHAQTALDSVRNIARGIYPAILADFGLPEALRAQARRAGVDLSILGSAPRSSEGSEEAVYFACSEAIQNAAKHAGSGARCTLRLRHHAQSLAVQIADDGRGFDPDRTPGRGGLQNIRDRIAELGGTVKLASKPGRGTILTLSLPWPMAADQPR
jgi:signal transduction histidine kinase